MDTGPALEALEPFLPTGARFLPVVWWAAGGLVIGLVASRLACWVAAAPLRRSSGPHLHWTQRARAAYPALFVSGLFGILGPMWLGVFAALRSPFSALSGFAHGLAVAVACYVGALPVRRWIARHTTGWDPSLVELARGEWVGVALLLPQLFIMIAMMIFIDAPLGMEDGIAIALATAAFALVSYSAGVLPLRALGVVRRADGPLRAIVAEASQRSGVAVRAVWVAPWTLANAIAIPWSRELLFTPRLLAVLDRDEIAAITAHELGHLSEPIAVKVARSLGSAAFFFLGFSTLIIGSWGMAAFAACLVAFVLLSSALAKMARRMEHRADHVAHEHEQNDGSYARALEKLYRANGVPAVLPRKRAVHPHLYDRLTAAGVAPDYPRPEPPSRAWIWAGSATAAASSVLLALSLGWLPQRAARADGEFGPVPFWAVLSGDPATLHELGVARASDGAHEEAIAWLRAAQALAPGTHHSAAFAAQLSADAGRCGEAHALLADANARVGYEHDCTWIEDAEIALAECDTRD